MFDILFYNYNNLITDKIQFFIDYVNNLCKFNFKIVYNEAAFLLETKKSNIILIPAEIFDEVLLKVMKDKNSHKIIIVKVDKSLNEQTIKTILNNAVNSENINIPLKNGNKELKLSEIIYFENINRKIFLKTKDSLIQTTLTLKQSNELVAEFNFASPYISFILNLGWIEAIIGKDVLLKNRQTIPLSQKKSASFKRKYKQYLSLLY